MSAAKATNVKGKVTATNAKCEVRVVQEGDLIAAGEVVKTADGANVDLELISGGVKSLEGKQAITLDNEVVDNGSTDEKDSALLADSAEIDSIIGAISDGKSLDNLLQGTGVGLAVGRK